MKIYSVVVLACLPIFAADVPTTRISYQQAYGASKNPTALDPAKDLPRYPAVEPQDAIATWQVKPGFKLELAAAEPLVRDPIAISFDENGRMFVCEMIDYSEERERNPHLGRITMLEDTDGDGRYDKSTVFADNLPWPTGLIWANGGLFVGATPDIWRFEDRDGDGRAEVREKVFTGFGTGLARLNVQALLNSFVWGQDNRIHVQSGTGNRGKISSPKRPDLAAQELAARDFWFDPRTYEFGFEIGGAQYGMSFDNYGRKFGCSNSDHLQFWVHDDRHAGRNPFFQMPPARQSIAADGGAAEVFRLSPDEPWRIVRTRWRIAGVVRGVVEGGGRVSGYFTGATGTVVFRGDAYGEDFVNNTFTGDAGGQLVHRKIITADGVSLVGRRPADEQGFEFAASRDTWVRVVNLANAPDGTLHICDMYREVIEHPWSIPEEIKQHLDLNSGNDRGRIYRVVPTGTDWKRRGTVALGRATTAELVATLAHPNGWHRDTASRLLYERQDKTAVPALAALVRESSSPLARHHALGVLDGLRALEQGAVIVALADKDEHVRERGAALAEKFLGPASAELAEKLAALADDPAPRVRFQVALTSLTAIAQSLTYDRAEAVAAGTHWLLSNYVKIAERDAADPWISAALLSGPPALPAVLLELEPERLAAITRKSSAFMAKLVEVLAASKPELGYTMLIDFVTRPNTPPQWLRAFGEGLRRAGVTIEQADTGKKLTVVFTRAATTLADAKASEPARLEAIELLGVASPALSRPALTAVLAPGQPEAVQVAAIKALATQPVAEVTTALIRAWPHYTPKAKDAALAALMAREDRIIALLESMKAGKIAATDLSAAQVQSLANHKTPKVATLAKTALAAVIPPSRAEVAAKFQPAIAIKGDAARGKAHYLGRCMVCHRADGAGMELGPDLITVKNKGRDALLTAILDPHKEVAPHYIAFDVATKDGNAYTGMIARDDATSLSLKIMGGAEVTIPRANVRGSSSSGKSVMPEGLEAGMSVQDMADLLTFIENL
ncbi:MAG: c-type cytochrome [Opitutaceae bacterium]|nr:c-type cytochrome [Opitutaceae bacterium]